MNQYSIRAGSRDDVQLPEVVEYVCVSCHWMRAVDAKPRHVHSVHRQLHVVLLVSVKDPRLLAVFTEG